MTTDTLVGRQLGSYVIRALLGRGGMGEVYKAVDTRLDRTVAIKVLPPSLRDDAERRQRLEREAKALAAISHPHICPLFDIGHQDGTDFLVMEYLQGETLAARLDRGKLPFDEVLRHAIEIADALAAAHQQGVVHRDLKPGNIMLTRNGVRLLDFGLATRQLHDPVPDTSAADTLTLPGSILGTPRYMAPEQIEGREADKRSDIFAFGAIVHEMATGTRAFDGESAARVMAAILERDPPSVSSGQPLAPPVLDRLVRTCLAKDPDGRWQSASDLARELRSIAGPESGHGMLHTAATTRRRPFYVARPVQVIAAAAVLGAVVFAVWRWPRSPEPSLRLRPFTLAAHEGEAVWSPDGKAVAVAVKQEPTAVDPWQVHVRYLDSEVATVLTRGPWDANPVAWTRDNKIIFATNRPPAGLWTVSSLGGEPRPLIRMPYGPARNDVSLSPDGSALAYAAPGPDGFMRVLIHSPVEAEPKPYEPLPAGLQAIAGGGAIRFSPDGRQLLLQTRRQLWLLPYPPDAALESRRILQALPSALFDPMFSWMPDSRRMVVATASSPDTPVRLHLVDTVSGKLALLPDVSGTTQQRGPAVSPSGDTVAYSELSSDHDVVSLNLETAAVTRLSVNSPLRDEMPAWSSDGSAMVYVTNRNGAPEIWIHRPGEGPARRLVTGDRFPTGKTLGFASPALSTDAGRVIYVRRVDRGPEELWASSATSPHAAPVRLIRRKDSDRSAELSATWSPDDKSFVYWKAQGNTWTLMTASTAGEMEPVELTKTSTAGWWAPVWSPDDQWILYGDNGLKLISPDGARRRDLGIRGALCTFARDGQRLLCADAPAQDRSREIFSMNLQGKERRHIGRVPFENAPHTDFPGQRLTLGPDGSVTYSMRRIWAHLFLIEGLAAFCDSTFGESCTGGG